MLKPEVLAIAFGFFIVHTTIDSFVYVRTYLSVILEESCKLYSSAYFASAMFIGLIGIIVVYGVSPTRN